MPISKPTSAPAAAAAVAAAVLRYHEELGNKSSDFPPSNTLTPMAMPLVRQLRSGSTSSTTSSSSIYTASHDPTRSLFSLEATHGRAFFTEARGCSADTRNTSCVPLNYDRSHHNYLYSVSHETIVKTPYAPPVLLMSPSYIAQKPSILYSETPRPLQNYCNRNINVSDGSDSKTFLHAPVFGEAQLESLERAPRCCFSKNGGCCFSGNEDFCFSDHDGRCFSDGGGCCCTDDNDGLCCSVGGGVRWFLKDLLLQRGMWRRGYKNNRNER